MAKSYVWSNLYEEIRDGSLDKKWQCKYGNGNGSPGIKRITDNGPENPKPIVGGTLIELEGRTY